MENDKCNTCGLSFLQGEEQHSTLSVTCHSDPGVCVERVVRRCAEIARRVGTTGIVDAHIRNEFSFVFEK
jgi:hypothetical protein